MQKIDDIDDPNYYSIELEKQKAEHDRMVKLAEEKKQVRFLRLRAGFHHKNLLESLPCARIITSKRALGRNLTSLSRRPLS